MFSGMRCAVTHDMLPIQPPACRAGCCTQWLIYGAYVADQEAQRRSEADTTKRIAAARKGAAGTAHAAGGDAKDASPAEPTAEAVRADEVSVAVKLPLSARHDG